MYGMVNQAVRGMVIEKFGAQTWTQIHTGAAAPGDFVAMQPYDDDVTYRLVGQAVTVLHIPADVILHAFGEYWVQSVATQHYAALMSSSGKDFVDFLGNLDHMHQRIRTTFPHYRPPSFRVRPLRPGLLQVDYYSERQGLLPFVVGLFTGLAAHFKVTISIEHVDDSAHRLPCKRFVVHHAPQG